MLVCTGGDHHLRAGRRKVAQIVTLLFGVSYPIGDDLFFGGLNVNDICGGTDGVRVNWQVN